MNYNKEIIDLRVGLEEDILGALLIDSYAITQVIDFLSWKNFSVRNHQIVWGAMTYLFPTNPIDLNTVRYLIKQRVGIDMCKYLVHLQRSVNSYAHLQKWAIDLVKLDVRGKLTNHVREYIKMGSPAKDKAWEDVDHLFRELSKSNNDIFSITNRSRRYFLDKFPEHHITALLKPYDEGFFKRAEQIQKRQSVRTLVEHLKSYGKPLDVEKSRAVEILTELIKEILISEKLPTSVEYFMNSKSMQS